MRPGEEVRWRWTDDGPWQRGTVQQAWVDAETGTFHAIVDQFDSRIDSYSTWFTTRPRPVGAHADRSRPVDAQPPNDGREPR